MLPVYYRWEKVPKELATRTRLRSERKRVPEDAQPAAEFEGGWGATYPLYLRSEAVAVPYKRPPKNYPALFAERYPEPRAAYLAGCLALHSLNRFAKHEECPHYRRREIYRLKDRWTERLWQEGFCIGAIRVFTPRKKLTCWDCGGLGEYAALTPCYSCDGTGIYRVVGGHPFWGLRFLVDGQTFFWHQPEHLAPWACAKGEEAPHEVIVTEKPVQLKPGKLKEAIALLEWLLGPEPTPELVPEQIGLRDYWTRDWQAEPALDPEEIPF